MEPVNIFIAYARKDKDLLEKLRTPLNVLKRHGHCEIFFDGEIKPGEQWDKRLRDELHRAEIIVLLVTDDFLDSDYVNEVELPKALELHQQGKTRVLPIILRHCMWRFTQLSAFQTILKDDLPIEETNGYSWAALQVAETIKYVRDGRSAIEIPKTQMIVEEEQKRSNKESRILDPFENLMVPVEGGSFEMGTHQKYQLVESRPPHPVRVASFMLSRYLVTREQYFNIMGENPAVKRKNEPMSRVSWEEAREFCKKLNEQTGKKYRFPTEAEWEYAARGGKGKKKFEFSGSENLSEVGWFVKNSDGPQPVGQKKANNLGLYDMSGNVWEWCEDIWHDNYDNAPNNSKVWLADGDKRYRVIRGGSFEDTETYCRVFFRAYATLKTKQMYIGFRLAHDYPM